MDCKEKVKMFEDRMNQITNFAKDNGNCISYRVLVDILKDKNNDISMDDIGEVIDNLSSEGIEVQMSEDDEEYDDHGGEDKSSFIPADVNITPRNITLDSIVDRLEHNEINLTPDFQRRGNLWSKQQQCQLIESLMLKIPLPTFYFDASDDNKWVVIDGLQRLTAFKNFMVDKELKLEGLEYLKNFEGCTFDNLPRQYYRRIRETQVTIYTVEKGTPDDVVFNIFKRINTGGLVLTPQEIRHALYQGPVTDLIGRLVKEKSFIDATGKSLKADRMVDREYVTRYIAFTELNYQKDYMGNIDSFLTKALKQVNGYSEGYKIEQISDNFVRVMDYCHRIFGKYAFRRVNSEYRRGPINKAIFELWSICFNLLSDNELDYLVQHRDIVLNRFIELLEEQDFATSIKAGDKYSLDNRVSKTKTMIKEILHDK